MYVCVYIDLMTISVFLVDVTMIDLLKNKNMMMMMCLVFQFYFLLFRYRCGKRDVCCTTCKETARYTDLHFTVFHSNTTT